MSKSKQLITDENNPFKRKVVVPEDIYKVPAEVEAPKVDPAPTPQIDPAEPRPKAKDLKESLVGYKQYGTYLRPETIKELRRLAFEREQPATQIIREAVEDYLRRNKP